MQLLGRMRVSCLRDMGRETAIGFSSSRGDFRRLSARFRRRLIAACDSSIVAPLSGNDAGPCSHICCVHLACVTSRFSFTTCIQVGHSFERCPRSLAARAISFIGEFDLSGQSLAVLRSSTCATVRPTAKRKWTET